MASMFGQGSFMVKDVGRSTGARMMPSRSRARYTKTC